MLTKVGRPGASPIVTKPSPEVFRLTDATSKAEVGAPAGTEGACLSRAESRGCAARVAVVSAPAMRSSVFIEKPRPLDARPDRLVGAAAPFDDTLSTTDVVDTQGVRYWFRLTPFRPIWADRPET